MDVRNIVPREIARVDVVFDMCRRAVMEWM